MTGKLLVNSVQICLGVLTEYNNLCLFLYKA